MTEPAETINPTETLVRAAERVAQSLIDSRWVFNHLPIGLFVLDTVDNGFTLILGNEFLEQLYGFKVKDFIGVRMGEIPAIVNGKAIFQHAEVAVHSKHPIQFESEIRNGTGDLFLSCSITPLINDEGKVVQLLGTVADRTSEKEAEKNLLHHALHDPLTELPNRILFNDEIEKALQGRMEDPELQVGLVVMNVDRFQQINETLGHIAGDDFLITLSNRISKIIEEPNILSRLNGDEFALLMPNLRHEDDLILIAEQIHSILDPPFEIAQSEFYSSVSIGLTSTHTSSPYPEELLRDADFALHRAKSHGRRQTKKYQSDKHQEARSMFLMEIELRRAIDRGQLELFYQPIIDLNTGQLVSFEALTRWRHPEKGLIPPDDFIPLAEETGLIVGLGRWALVTACQQMRDWLDSYDIAQHMKMAVNVSNAQFSRTNVTEDVATALSQAGISAKYLSLELTETTVMEHQSEAKQYLNDLRDMGVHLALDDFGTGYSSLSALHHYPIDMVKIDRSFVSGLKPGGDDLKIVEIITLLGKALELDVLAEGIEQPEQIEIMRKLGCQYGQGYLFSRPVPKDELVQFMKKPNLLDGIRLNDKLDKEK